MRKKLFTLLLAVAASVGTMFASSTIGGISYNLDKSTLTAEVTYRGSSYYNNEYSGAIIIPTTVYQSVNGKLYTFTVTSIGENAFRQSSGLTSVTIPKSVTSIGNNAFSDCTNLISINVDTYNTNYISEDGVLFNKNKTTLKQYPAGMTGNYSIPNSVISIEEGAFNGCSKLTSVTIPNSVTSIGNHAFYYCSKLVSIEIPNSVTSIGESVFALCSKLTSVTISDSVTTIGNYAFYYCYELVSVEIPDRVISIGNYAFYRCESLTSMTIPSSVTNIGDYAFSVCRGLTSVLIEAETPPSLGDWAFDGDNSLTSIYVPCGTMEAYISKTGWSNYTSLIKYQPLPYTIITNAQNGSISIESCSDITLTAIPDDGYYFTQWSDGNTDNPRTIVLIQDTTFSAEFSKKQYSINVSCDELCGIINGENGKFDYFSEHTYEAVPNEGYIFQQWSDGNEDNPRTIVLTQDTTITAEFGFFGALLCNVSVQSVNPGMGSASFSDLLETENLNYGQYPTGTNLIAKAQPNQGYKFLHWSDGSTANPYSFILTSDVSLTAYFEQSSTSQPENSTFWNMSDDPFNLLGTITSTQTIDGLTIYATYSKNVVIDESNQEIDGLSFTHRLKFGGAGTSDARMLSFEVNGDCNIDIYLKSASGSADRTLNVDKGSFGNTLQQIPAYGSTISKGTVYYIGNTTTIYLYSPSSGVNIYAIRVTYTTNVSVAIENTYLVQEERTQKILHNGQILILRGDKTYTLQGQEVK